jgi:hypothetical protein
MDASPSDPLLASLDRIRALLASDNRAILLRDALDDAERSGASLRAALVETSVELLSARREVEAVRTALEDAEHAAAAAVAASAALSASDVSPALRAALRGERAQGCCASCSACSACYRYMACATCCGVRGTAWRSAFVLAGVAVGGAVVSASAGGSAARGAASAFLALLLVMRGALGTAHAATALRAAAAVISLPITVRLLVDAPAHAVAFSWDGVMPQFSPSVLAPPALNESMRDAPEMSAVSLALAAFWFLSSAFSFAGSYRAVARARFARARLSLSLAHCLDGASSVATARATPLAILEVDALNASASRALAVSTLVILLSCALAAGWCPGVPRLVALPAMLREATLSVLACSSREDMAAALAKAASELQVALASDGGSLLFAAFLPVIAVST